MSQIIDTTDLSTFMKKTLDDGLATKIVNGINDWIETRTHRCWGEIKQVVERYDWAPTLWLRHQDVIEVKALKFGYPGQQQSTLGAGGYYVNSFGRLTLYVQDPRSFSPSMLGNDLIEVTYTYGAQEVPGDLQAAALGIASNMYNWAVNGSKDVSSVSVGTYRLDFSGGRPNPNGNPAAASVAEANFQTIASHAMQRM